jgi:hypothetical protein
MTDREYSEAEVMRATHAGAQELFGRDTLAASMLAGEVAMKLLAGAVEQERPTPEAIDWNSPPDYALRAIRASSTRELTDLITNGADRLSKSIATYCNTFAYRPEEAHGTTALHPMIFAEGSRVGENLVGRLFIHVSPDGEDFRGGVADLSLEGGEGSSYDYLADAKPSPFLSRSLSIRQTMINDPVTKQRRPAYYPEVSVRYNGDMFRGDDGLLFEAKYGKPIDAYGHVVVADLFWALDMAITYYEGVYIAGNKHPGLTYGDYRDAGCLKDDLTLDNAKAEAYVRTYMDDETVGRRGGWPVLRNWEETTVTMDPAAREQIEKHKSYLRPTIAVNQPHLMYVS